MSSKWPTFRNDNAALEIRIGVREFNCMGVSPPHDHPHVYLNMGAAHTILCPYCATPYRFDSALGPTETEPPGNLFTEEQAGRTTAELSREQNRSRSDKKMGEAVSRWEDEGGALRQ
jgi:uncharacterized Zn-finger protein